MSLFAFAVVFVGWCGCLRLLSDLLGGAGVSAVGTTLPQSPGWNEGKARNATLGKQYKSGLSSVGAALSARAFGLFAVCDFAFVGKVPPLWGSINVFQ